MKLTICPVCEGRGGWNEAPPELGMDWWECEFCKGTGRLSLWKALKFWVVNNAPEWFYDPVADILHRIDTRRRRHENQ